MYYDARNKVTAAFRQVLALALVTGLTLMNVQAAELHVHGAAGQIDDRHHHGPASHHHDEADRHSPSGTQVAAVVADDAVVHVALAAAFPQPVKPLHAEHAAAPLCDAGDPFIVDGARIVARSHGPPSLVQPSLRAPPARLLL